MKVRVKLFATFRKGRFDDETREYAEGARVADVARELGLVESELGIMLLNSRHCSLEQVLGEGDVLALFPLVGGG